MALEVWHGTTWVPLMTDPEVYDGSTWVNINHGEVWDGSDWVTFYRRNSNEVYVDLDTITKTKTSFTIGANNIGTDRRRAMVWDVADFFGTVKYTGAFTSNMVASDSATQLTFSGYSVGSTHTFDALIQYLDAGDNVTSSGPVMPVQHVDTTLDYTFTVPTTPVNTGTVSSTILSFKASSSSNYNNNGVAASVYFYLYNSLGVLKQTKAVALPNDDKTHERTATFYDVDYGTPHVCKARTYYGGAINNFSAYSAASASVSTNTFHVPVAPAKNDTNTDEDTIQMTSTGNAYSNGSAYMRWEKSTRTAGSPPEAPWSLSYFADSGNLLTNDSTSRFVSYDFTANQTDEYRFRAQVYYGDLTTYAGGGITDGYGSFGPYSVIVRPKLWVRQYKPSSTTYAAASDTALFPGSSIGASSENGVHVKGNVSDGSTSTFWESNPQKTVTGTATRSRTLAFFARTITVEAWRSTYYRLGSESDFDFDPDYPNVSTTVVSLRYGVQSMIYDAKTTFRVTMTLDSSTHVDLEAGDSLRVQGNSVSTYNQSYTIHSTSGTRTFYLTPSSTPSSTASGTGGTAVIFSTRGESVGVLGGTSARVATDGTYVQRDDGRYPYNVPLSAAAGTISWTVDTSTKVDKTSTDTDNVNVLFTPELPTGYRSARLEGVSVKVGTPAPSRIKIEVNGTERFDSSGFPISAEGTITISGFSATPTYAGNSFLINCIVYPGLYTDGKYYCDIKEIQIRYSYETLTG